MLELTIVGESFEGNVIEVEPQPLPEKMKEEHHRMMLDFFKLVNYILTNSDRKLPIMLSELLRIKEFNKKRIRELIEFGLLKTSTAPLIDKNTKKNLGVRTFIYWTPQGRAYTKKYLKFEDTNGRQEEDNGGTTGHSDDLQQAVPNVDGGDGVQSEL